MILQRFKEMGVLGMNARIGKYMLPSNNRKDYPKVDDKVITSDLAREHNIPMPENYAVFQTFGRLQNLSDILRPFKSFVIKPAAGSMGNGIIVIKGSSDDLFIRSNDEFITIRDLRYHMAQILSGLYSLSGYPDKVIVQYMIQLHPVFDTIAVNGVPDIRIIVYRGYPVMAMTRLPTIESNGRANLHQGAIGVGIDLLTGITRNAVYKSKTIYDHPDTGVPISGIAIPFWEQMVLMAVKGYDMTGLGYLGVDIALDAEKGPMVLEMNARPGLGIQIANLRGLRKRLELIEDLPGEGLPPEERISLAMETIRAMNE